MQLAESLIEFEMALPSPNAASAMPAPMIARIRAYSAAEAPASSFSMLMKVFIVPILPKHPASVHRHGFPLRVGRRNFNRTQLGPCLGTECCLADGRSPPGTLSTPTAAPGLTPCQLKI